MNIMQSQKSNLYQLEPIIQGPIKNRKHGAKVRDFIAQESLKMEMQKYDTLNSSLMNYEEMDSSVSVEKRKSKRNMTAIRKHTEIYTNNSRTGVYRNGKILKA